MFIPAHQPELPAEIAEQKRKYKYLINNGRFNMMWQTGYESWRKPIVADRWGDREDTFLRVEPKRRESARRAERRTSYAFTMTMRAPQAIAYVTDAVKPANHSCYSRSRRRERPASS